MSLPYRYFISLLLLSALYIGNGPIVCKNFQYKYRKYCRAVQQAPEITMEDYTNFKLLDELPFVISICSFNDAQWVEKTLDSVIKQEYKNFRVVFVDDASSDTTVLLVKQYIEQHNLHDKIKLIANDVRRRKLNNIYNVFHACKDNEIIVQLDADDWLAHEKVLLKLNAVFHNPNVWFSYGQFKRYPEEKLGWCREIPEDIKINAKFREFPWVTSHVKAFYAWLVKAVKLEDLLTENIQKWKGKFYSAANDLATVFPMLDMARERIKFVPEIMYIYNYSNPLVGCILEKSIQDACAKEIRTLPTYERLKKPLTNRLEKFDTAKADLFLLAFNNDAKKVARLLLRCKKMIKGLGTKLIIYNSTESALVNEFNTIEKEMTDTLCINLQATNNSCLDDYLALLPHDHIVVATDAIKIQQSINIVEAIRELERTFAHGFYFSLSPSKFDEYHVPCQYIKDDMYAWKFKTDILQLFHVNNYDFTLYRKKDFAHYTSGQIKVDGRKIGLFYGTSKSK